MNKKIKEASNRVQGMKRKIATAILAGALAQLSLADSTVQQAQEELKAQGYYFGPIDGDRNADTIAAIRRFQIRNGLRVTGDLDEETVRALQANASSSTAATTPPPQSQNLEGSENSTERVAPAPPPRDLQADREQPAPAASIFRNTPYETAPPELQQRVIFGAQTLLRRRGFYKGESDGVFGTSLEFSLRAFQSRLGLPPNGRLDMDTLAALGLLPGQHGRPPMEIPHRRIVPSEEPPVRGEWIH